MTANSQRFICIHGHFYQPPREDPWLDVVQVQDSAYPYHDWNQRVTAQCYAPNAWAHLLDAQGRLDRLVSNYARISFDFGPTLLAWLERQATEVYQAVLEADNESQRRYGGHGSALAQPYNHMILPLANSRDKQTQVRWGLEDFHYRFRRQPEGMWLPETAVDMETLETLAEQGIHFTILEPQQALRVRPLAGGPWTGVSSGRIDTTHPYLVRLPSGRSIAAFFYHGPLSRSVAFEGLLRSGDALAQGLTGAFHSSDAPQLAHIATDGESYGHHHRFGDMALAYALDLLERQGSVRLTNYGQYLEMYPPLWEVEIAENTSWSCVHGVERWRSDCGCKTGSPPSWSQAWRKPLRDALDWLRDALSPLYDQAASRLLSDPWAARDDYISVVLDRSPERVDAFFLRHAVRRLSKDQRVSALKLLELQRHAMLMFTSCGWFFDEPSRVETVQVLRYAARAIQLAREVFQEDLEPAFLELLAPAKSNLPEQGDCRRIYQRHVKPKVLDWDAVAAYYAVASLFRESPNIFYSFAVQEGEVGRKQTPRRRSLIGRATFMSQVTEEMAERAFLAWDNNWHEVEGRVAHLAQQEYQRLAGLFSGGGRPPSLAKAFGGKALSMEDLFEDERLAVLEAAMEEALVPAEPLFWRSYHWRSKEIEALVGLGAPVPRDMQTAAEFFLGRILLRTVRDSQVTAEALGFHMSNARVLQAQLDGDALGYELGRTLALEMTHLSASPGDLALLKRLTTLAQAVGGLPFAVHIAEAQDRLWRFLRSSQGIALLRGGGAEDQRKRELLVALADALWVVMG